MSTKRIPVSELFAGSVDSKPINVDGWQGMFYDDRDGNNFWEAQKCDKCGELRVFEGGGGNERHHDIDDESECDGYFDAAEGPMMNYWYPVDEYRFDAETAAGRFADLPLCVVKVGEVYGIALTGGGQNLTWEICEAFTRIGQLPPAHFAGDLPRMCGRGGMGGYNKARDRYIIAACRESLRTVIVRAQGGIRRLRGIMAERKN